MQCAPYKSNVEEGGYSETLTKFY